MTWRVGAYGEHSPLSEDERETVEQVYRAVRASDNARSRELLGIVDEHVDRLEAFGALLAGYPSPLSEQRLGARQRDLGTLVDELCRSDPANFEFRAPTRAIIGRALDMAELNFYRLLWNICDRELSGADDLRDSVAERFRVTIHTKLMEELLGDLATDGRLAREIRERAVHGLVKIWDRRLTYRVAEFFPVLQATWDARQRVRVIGGTLKGTHEVFELFRQGCDPQFIDYFIRHDPSDDELEAFREFLFATSAERLDELADEMAAAGAGAVELSAARRFDRDAGVVFYEFFRERSLMAWARRLADLPGPKRTAEGYVMIAHLSRGDET